MKGWLRCRSTSCERMAAVQIEKLWKDRCRSDRMAANDIRFFLAEGK